MRIEGGNQGVAIQINGDSPDRDQNWITFFNENGEAQGRIEGSSINLIEDIEVILKGINEGASKRNNRNEIYVFDIQGVLIA